MEFSIISAPLKFCEGDNVDEEIPWFVFATQEVSLISKAVQYGESHYQNQILEMLEKQIERRTGKVKWEQCFRMVVLFGMVRISICHTPNTQELKFAIRDLNDVNYYLSRLLETFGVQNLTFQFTLEISGGSDDGVFEFTFPNATLTTNQPDSTLFLLTCSEVPDTVFGDTEWSNPVQDFKGHLNGTLIFSDEAVNSLFTGRSQETPLAYVHRNAYATDAVIEVEGQEFQCHTAVLISQSPVFEQIFRDSMQESGTNTLEITDITPQIFGALLRYLYTWDVEEMLRSCTLAFHLLIVGDAFDIKCLREDMMKILFCKGVNWYTADVICHLLQFARRKIEQGEDYSRLEKMAFTALKLKPCNEVKDSLVFKNILRDPSEGMSFFLHSLHCKKNFVPRDEPPN